MWYSIYLWGIIALRSVALCLKKIQIYKPESWFVYLNFFEPESYSSGAKGMKEMLKKYVLLVHV